MADAPDPLKDSCAYAMELTKQFLTLSAAGIAFIVGLVYADKPGKISPCAVGWSLSLFGLSIVSGWLFQMRMIGKVNKEKSHDVYEGFAQMVSILQILFFCAGVLVLFAPTLRTARTQEASTIPSPTPMPVYLLPTPTPGKTTPTLQP